MKTKTKQIVMQDHSITHDNSHVHHLIIALLAVSLFAFLIFVCSTVPIRESRCNC